MKPMPNLMETELESFGASTIEDFTWKQLLDTDACTMCGRCTAVCPAHATGKPLDPREIVLKTGEVMAATGSPAGVAADRRRCPRSPIGADSVFERIHLRRGVGLHHVQGVRRDLPGQHRDPRQDPRHAPLPVAHGVRLPHRAGQRLPVDGELRQPVGHEPGRAGRLGRQARGHRDHRRLATRSTPSTSTGSAAPDRSTTRTRRSPRRWPSCSSGPDIDFAILGPSEMCTGDPARRSGNEYIFQMLAMQNIETLETAWA